MESIIALNVTNSKSYQEYRTIVTQLVEQNSTSGNDTSEAMVNYTMLNDRRMKRWDKTIKLSDEVIKRVSNFKGDITWLVLTESWCGDAAHVVPAINKCGIVVKSPTIGIPEILFPRAIGNLISLF